MTDLKEINKGKQPIFLSDESLQKVKKPIPMAHYKKAIEDIKDEEYNRYEYIKCNICNKKYTKNNKFHHYKTKHHIFCEGLNKKWRKMLIDI